MMSWRTSITRRRFSASSYDPATGRWSQGEYAEAPLLGVVLPQPGAVTVLLESGRRVADTIHVFVERGSLREGSPFSGHPPDRILPAVFGAWYEVAIVEEYDVPTFLLNHQRVVCQLVDEADRDPGTAPDPEP